MMNSVTLPTVQIQLHSCQWQVNRPDLPLRNVEDGVKRIAIIFEKDLLCRHDIETIDRIYQEILLKYKTSDILANITNKIEALASVENLGKSQVNNVKCLISLYHFKRFSACGPSVDAYFNTFYSKFGKDPSTLAMIAIQFPTCGTEVHFYEDTTFFLGPRQSNAIGQYLLTKQIKLRDHTWGQLDKLRKTAPEKYPPYLDQLLDNGHIHLYDHLMQMKLLSSREEREAAIQQLTFSCISHIVLEARAAIIQKVESSLPEGANNFLFLVGSSGTGKSTTLCFLRGDQMELKDSHYGSKSDNRRLIGDNLADSHTFLPTVVVTESRIIVDFPGFEDSHGSLISLGLECALKALIEKYHPQILVLESITSMEDRLNKAGQLGLRLERLLDNKEKCVLGFTKYTKDPDYRKIKTLEEQQREELLKSTQEEAKQEESKLTIEIKQFSDMIPLLKANNNDLASNFQKQVEEKQKRLQEIKEKIEQQKQQGPINLPETEEKTQHRKNIVEKEEILLREIGLNNFIRLDNLENPDLQSSCFASLSKAKALSVNTKHPLDQNHETTIKTIFDADLMEKTKDIVPDDLKDLENFEKSIMESSLINTIFSWIHPEIGQFLHMPEIDPEIVRDYDSRIVKDCINKYINSVILGFDVPPTTTMEKELKGKIPRDEINKLVTSVQGFKNFLATQKMPNLNDQDNLDEKWKQIQEKVKASVGNAEKQYDLAIWARVLMGIPLGIPLGMHQLLRWREVKETETTAFKQIVNNICQAIEKAYQTIAKLKELQILIDVRSTVLVQVKEDGMHLQEIKEEYKKIKGIVIAAVQQNGLALQYADESCKKDMGIGLAALRQNGMALQYIDESLKKNIEIVIAAVTQNGLMLQYVDNSLKKEMRPSSSKSPRGRSHAREITLAAVTQNGMALQYADVSFKKDSEIALVAVKQNGLALDWVDVSVKDKRLVLTAVAQNGMALNCADPDQRNDDDIVFVAVQENGLALQFASKKLKSDPTTALAAIRQNTNAFQYADDTIKTQQDFLLDAIQIHAQVLLRIQENFTQNSDFILFAVRRNGNTLEYVKEKFKKDKDVVLAAVKQNGMALKCAHSILKQDLEIVTAAFVKNNESLQYVRDKKCILSFLWLRGEALQWVDLSLRKDKEIVLAAVQQNACAIEYADESLKKDRDFILELVRLNALALQYVDESFKNDKWIIFAAVKQNALMFQYANNDLKKDRDIILELVKLNALVFQYVDESFRKDKWIIFAAGFGL